MWWELLQLMVNGLVSGSVFALGAAGISLVVGWGIRPARRSRRR